MSRMNVPIDGPHHDDLKRIAILEKTTMRALVERWIDQDGRGKLVQPVKIPPGAGP